MLKISRADDNQGGKNCRRGKSEERRISIIYLAAVGERFGFVHLFNASRSPQRSREGYGQRSVMTKTLNEKASKRL
jgi:hypothetical protein